MIIVKKEGLTPAQIQKVKQPHARNKGKPVNFALAAKEADAFLGEQPGLLRETAALLNETHDGHKDAH